MKKKNNHALDYQAPKKNGMPRWKSRLENYRANELSLLTFLTDDEADAATDLVWVGNLQGMPFNLGPDGYSLVVPTKSIPYFTKAGLQFEKKQLAK